MASLARSERAELANLFDQLGPDAPTLCAGWSTRELLQHLLVRERRPAAAIGIWIKPLAPLTNRAGAGYAQRPWSELVSLYRSGPPVWNPARLDPIDELVNGAEMFVHHEDARRGRPGWRRRTFDAATESRLRALLGSAAVTWQLRRSRLGVVADLPDGTRIPLSTGVPEVTIAGDAGEIVLWLCGRDEVEVQFSGDGAAVAKVRALDRSR